MKRTSLESTSPETTAGTALEMGSDLFQLDPDTIQPRELSHEATVPRGLVHRSAIAEVFVTDSRPVGPTRFEVAAQLPRGHVMLEHTVHDMSLLLEAGRQAGVLVSHRHLDVPMDRVFIMNQLALNVTDLAGLEQGTDPGRLVVDVDATLHTNSGGRLRGYDFTGVWTIDGTRVAEGTGSLTFINKRAYAALRTRARSALDLSVAAPTPLPAAPETVGRRDRRNVVITDPVAADPDRWSATVVPAFGHPHLFDHPLDHLPGNLVIEAARQLTVAAAARSWGVDPATLVPVSVEAEFTDYCENDLATRLEADLTPFRTSGLGPVAGAEVRICQNDTVRSTIRVEVAQWT